MSEFMNAILAQAVKMEASDIYMACGALPSLRVEDRIMPLTQYQPLTKEKINEAMEFLLSENQQDEFQATLELNTAYFWQPDGDETQARFRINVFQQQQLPGMVLRRIKTVIPTLEQLGLPAVYGELIMEKRGLVLVTGPTGSGKTTSMAAMIGHRNQKGSGHIITVEDPIEFVHAHAGCLVTQRDIGIDTYSFAMALKNALRQRPDVVLIGEIRDKDTMEHALTFAETGHLCLATLHANNANQAIERVLNFFSEDKHPQVLQGLALNLKAILSQRLVETKTHGRTIAVEILRNQGLLTQLIEEGKVKEIKEVMEKNQDQGMQSFDQSLFDLVKRGIITEDVAVLEADNPANLRLRFRQAAGLPGIAAAPSRPAITTSSGTGF
jgi:twitching motility protein PilU